MQGINGLSIKTDLIIQRGLPKITYRTRIVERKGHDEGRRGPKDDGRNPKIMVQEDKDH